MGSGLGFALLLSSSPHSPHLTRPFLPLLRLRSPPPPPSVTSSRLHTFNPNCCVTNLDLQLDHPIPITSHHDEFHDLPSIPLVTLTAAADNDLSTQPFPLLHPPQDSLFEELPVFADALPHFLLLLLQC